MHVLPLAGHSKCFGGKLEKTLTPTGMWLLSSPLYSVSLSSYCWPTGPFHVWLESVGERTTILCTLQPMLRRSLMELCDQHSSTVVRNVRQVHACTSQSLFGQRQVCSCINIYAHSLVHNLTLQIRDGMIEAVKQMKVGSVSHLITAIFHFWFSFSFFSRKTSLHLRHVW